MNDDDRIEGLDRLARTRSPERDLWPGISARLAPRRRAHFPFQLALAASVVMGLALVFTLSLSRLPFDSGVAGNAALAPGLSLGRDRAIVKANLGIVQQSKHQLRDALRHDPNSAGLRQLLAQTERREHDLRALL